MATAILLPMFVIGIIVVAGVLHRRRGAANMKGADNDKEVVGQDNATFSPFEFVNPVRHTCIQSNFTERDTSRLHDTR
jgi:quinol-cytochrome oxidoreductase complex cytochrome b subunit